MRYRVVVEEEAVVSWYYDVEAEDGTEALMKAQQGDVVPMLGEIFSSEDSENSGALWQFAEIVEMEDENV